MTRPLVLRGIRPYGEGDPVDLLVRDGLIAELGTRVDGTGAEVLDGGGLVALPGLVDLHAHLREPGREDAETIATASAAAALGGYTAVFAMANTDPVADTAVVVEYVYRRGREVGLVDVHPVGAVTAGLGGERLAELGAMASSAAAVRMFSDDGLCVHDSLLMRRALEYTRGLGGVVAQHAEDPRLTAGAQAHEGRVAARLGLAGWPRAAEESIVARDCLLARDADAALHICHVSTAGTVELLRWAKQRGIRVSAEVTPHHLLLTDEQIGEATDQGRPIAVGQPANLTVVDPDATWTVRGAQLASLADNTPYEGMELPGRVVVSILRGRVTTEDGKVLG
jgi:dihydroorotase